LNITVLSYQIAFNLSITVSVYGSQLVHTYSSSSLFHHEKYFSPLVAHGRVISSQGCPEFDSLSEDHPSAS
jgi:hypothetical protein